MNPRMLELGLRRQELQFRCRAQRAVLSRQLDAVTDAVERVERVRDGVDWIRANTPLLAGLVVGLIVLRPRASVRWLRRGLVAWQLFRRSAALRALLQRALATLTH